MKSDAYPCSACGFLVFGEPPGSFEICPICGWEDDAVQANHPHFRGGANAESLAEAQQVAIENWPQSIRVVGDVERDPEWYPLAANTKEADRKPPTLQRAGSDAVLFESGYYWRIVQSEHQEIDDGSEGRGGGRGPV